MSKSTGTTVPRRSKGLTIAAIFTALICIVALAAYLTIMGEPNIQSDTRVYVPAGASKQQMHDSLSAHLGNGYASLTLALWSLQGGDPAKAHGSYVVTPSTTALKLSRNLKFGRQTPVHVTLNNLRTIDQLRQKVAERLEFSPADFITGCDSVLAGVNTPNYIAHFVPDSYEFYWTATPQRVVATLTATRDKFWNDERTAKAKAMGLTPDQVATLASIVEEETAKADEMPQVARLYLNRLDKGMKLQADPTVKFAAGDFTLRRILNKHLATDSPYNTYLHAGLPPGPIRMATRQGIDAVLNAPQHPYLYMCAKEDFSGYHNFAATYNEHLANAKRYQQQLNKKGIK